MNCKFALEQKRYTWRHDSVLANIRCALAGLVEKFNKLKLGVHTMATKNSFSTCFVKKGDPKRKLAKDSRPRFSQSIIECANDWKLLVDLDKNNVVFPPSIIATSLRPDIVLWSNRSRIVVLIELTCCAEEGIRAAQLRKETKYSELVDSINETKLWKASLYTIEIGARGLVATTTHRIFVQLGFSSAQESLCVRCFRVWLRDVHTQSTLRTITLPGAMELT